MCETCEKIILNYPYVSDKIRCKECGKTTRQILNPNNQRMKWKLSPQLERALEIELTDAYLKGKEEGKHEKG